MRIVITGATGLLGRNLLFEAIKQNLADPKETDIFLLGRGTQGGSLEQRIRAQILHDGADYLSDACSDAHLQTFVERSIHCVDTDLDSDRLGLSPDDFAALRREPIDFFFHVAALTDFRDTPAVVTALERTNVAGTRQVLELVRALQVRQLCYVSSAYACGGRSGQIGPDDVDTAARFRNPYERTKLDAEMLVRAATDLRGVKRRIFRPSTISGRLLERPFGATNKFDVFYSWAAFFLRLKAKAAGRWDRRYSDPRELALRACYSRQSGLNIVPADYAAKILYAVCAQDDPSDSFHLTNAQETPHETYIDEMLRAVNVSGVRRVDGIPADPNRLERLYYKTVGAIFTPYITAPPMLFDVSNLEAVATSTGLRCPMVDRQGFSVLMDYAKDRDFGLDPAGMAAA